MRNPKLERARVFSQLLTLLGRDLRLVKNYSDKKFRKEQLAGVLDVAVNSVISVIVVVGMYEQSYRLHDVLTVHNYDLAP